MNAPAKQNIRSLTYEELLDYFTKKNEPSYHAAQVFDWLWKKDIRSFDELSNLSIHMRKELSDDFVIDSAEACAVQSGPDGTVKFGFRLYDAHIIEGVLIPDHGRQTACVSTQAGCSLNCSFCATGKLGRKRNLHADEIYRQVFLINKYCFEKFNTKLANVVLMGMGEPLLNYKNVMRAISMVVSPKGLGMSPQRITLSTAGIAKMIKQLADDNAKFNLAVSLHSANDDKRTLLMPVNLQNNIAMLAEAIKYFYNKTGKRIFYEYLLLKDFNDSTADAKELADFCKITPCKINVIEYNRTEGSEWEKPGRDRIIRFIEFLRKRNLLVYYRRSRGGDIDAACGQLAGKIQIPEKECLSLTR